MNKFNKVWCAVCGAMLVFNALVGDWFWFTILAVVLAVIITSPDNV